VKNPEIENEIQILFLLTLLTLPRREWFFAGVFFEAPALKILQSENKIQDTQGNQPFFSLDTGKSKNGLRRRKGINRSLKTRKTHN